MTTIRKQSEVAQAQRTVNRLKVSEYPQPPDIIGQNAADAKKRLNDWHYQLITVLLRQFEELAAQITSTTVVQPSTTLTPEQIAEIQALINSSITTQINQAIQSAISGAGSGTVVAETSFGQMPSPGSGSGLSFANHTHGSPANPIPSHLAAPDPHPQYALDTDIIDPVPYAIALGGL